MFLIKRVGGGAGGGGGSVTSVNSLTGAVVVDSNNIDVDFLAGATYSTLQQYLDIVSSTGEISGGIVTDDADGTITVTAGTGLIRATDSDVSDLWFTDWSAESGANVNLIDNALNFVYIEYNAGTPQAVATTTERTDLNTNIFVATVYRIGTELHISNENHVKITNQPSLLKQRFQAVDPYARESGGLLSETGTRNIACSATVLWQGLDKLNFGAIDTSVADTFIAYYRDGVGGWTDMLAQTQINNTQYDDGSGTLATLGNSRYGIHWVYRGADGDTYVVFGQDSYTLLDAESAPLPASLPPHFERHARVYGKIIIAKNDSSFTLIESAFDTEFALGVPTDHEDLIGLQGGTTSEHYHLTATQHTELTTGTLKSTTGSVTLETTLDDTPFNLYFNETTPTTLEISNVNTDIQIKNLNNANHSHLTLDTAGSGASLFLRTGGATHIQVNSTQALYRVPLTVGTGNFYDIGKASNGFKTGYFDTSVVTPLVSNDAGDLTLDASTTVGSDVIAKPNSTGAFIIDNGIRTLSWLENGTRGILALNTGELRLDAETNNISFYTSGGRAFQARASDVIFDKHLLATGSVNIGDSGTGAFQTIYTDVGVTNPSGDLTLDASTTVGADVIAIPNSTGVFAVENDGAGATDRVEISHDTTTGLVESVGGALNLKGVGMGFYIGGTQILSMDASNMYAEKRFRPLSNNAIDLGTSTVNWRDCFLSRSLSLAEVSTPTAIANRGAIYTKTDNKVYFQDGAGTEHEIAFV